MNLYCSRKICLTLYGNVTAKNSGIINSCHRVLWMNYRRQYYAKAPLNGLHECLFHYKNDPGHELEEIRQPGTLILEIQHSISFSVKSSHVVYGVEN